MAEQPAPGRVYSDGGVANNQIVGFPDGVDSYSHPMSVKPTQLRWMENGVTKGGPAQARPGYKTRFSFSLINGTPFQLWWITAGQPVIVPQMEVGFTPTGGKQQLVFAISGSVWYCHVLADGSLDVPQQISTLSFNVNADQLVGVACVQTATIVSGLYTNNQVPTNLLIIQDGVNRAGIWDGTTGYHANPIKRISVDALGNTLYTAGFNETRIGLWGAWSGNRYWVFNGVNGFASDLGDPTHFTEELTLTSFPVFTFPEPVTGAIDRGISGTTNSAIWVMTLNTTTALASGIQARLPSSSAVGWVNTPNFQTQMFSTVGCVAGKSIIVHRGLLYWRSKDGIVVFDSTGTVYSTQNLPPIDQEETYSKRRVAQDVSGSCAGIRDSYVFWSVPVGPVMNGRPCNGHTQVMDRQTSVVHTLGINGPFTYGTIGWQGVWTGIRPVEWSTVDAHGQTRVYALSMDQDGVARIWEAFQGNRADNGQQIPWMIETRTHPMADTIFETSVFQYFKLMLDQIIGNLTITGSWRGMKGLYHSLLNTSVTATPGSILTPLPGFVGIVNDTPQESFAVQTRDIFSPDVMGPQVDCQAAKVESPFNDAKDRGFSLALQFQGRGALVAYRLAANKQPDSTEGRGKSASGVSESGFNIVPEDDCPVHIEGTTPAYTLGDSPMNDAFVAILPVFPEGDLYQSPAA